jgi:ketosteroid isomerase-like protein
MQQVALLIMRNVGYILLIFFVHCKQISSDDQAIRITIDSLIAADNRGDLEAVLSHYADDATLMPPGKAPFSGTAKLKSNYENIFASVHLQLQTSIEGVELNNHSAFAWGTNSGTAVSITDSNVRKINDKYLMHLIKDGQDWKIQRLIWNSNE